MDDGKETRAQKCDRMLGELAELGLALARDLQARALAAETPAEATDLALAFHRISRSLRQTLALEARVERARLAAARAAALDAAEAERQARLARVGIQSPIEHRKDRVSRALNRLIWEEAERDQEEFEILTDDLANRLDEAALREDFGDIPIETLILQLKEDMGLSGELTLTTCAPPSSPDPSPEPPPTPASPPPPPPPLYPVGSDAWATGRPPDPG